MRVWPCAPLEINGVARVDVGVESSGGRALVAVDVGGPDGGGLNEANVLVQGVPACCLGTTVGGVVVPDGVGSVGEFAIDGDPGDEAVSRRGVQKDGGGAEEEDGGVHRDGRRWDWWWEMLVDGDGHLPYILLRSC